MTKYLFLFILPFSVFNGNAQYKIIDSETKAPVSYARIKIANQQRGTITDFEGVFYLDSIFNISDTVVFSCIGYINRPVLIKDLETNEIIELEPWHQQLSEVVVSVKKIKYQVKKLGVLRKPGKIKVDDYTGTAKNGEEKAIWIPNKHSIKGHLKAINIYISDVGYPDAHFRVHVYQCSPFETKPSKELTTSNIIASGTSGNQWITIDLNKEQIQIGENGCFVGIEWFDSPKSKFHKDTIYSKGVTFNEDKRKDTIYSDIRSGNGVVLAAVYQKYRVSKNKLWHKNDENWSNQGTTDENQFYIAQTMPGGASYIMTPDSYHLGVLCINIDVAFPKNKIDLTFESPRKRELNKIEKTKIDLIKYPQANISELFSSMIKAVENDDLLYLFKYLCVYKNKELNEILNHLSFNGSKGKIITPKERNEMTEYLKEIQVKLDSSELKKIDSKQFELNTGSKSYSLTVDNGLWKIHPNTYRIYR